MVRTGEKVRSLINYDTIQQGDLLEVVSHDERHLEVTDNGERRICFTQKEVEEV